jgi:hypothetical protein
MNQRQPKQRGSLKLDLPIDFLIRPFPNRVEKFFKAVGMSLEHRTTPPPKLDPTAQAAFRKKAGKLAAKYRTELLPP